MVVVHKTFLSVPVPFGIGGLGLDNNLRIISTFREESRLKTLQGQEKKRGKKKSKNSLKMY